MDQRVKGGHLRSGPRDIAASPAPGFSLTGTVTGTNIRLPPRLMGEGNSVPLSWHRVSRAQAGYAELMRHRALVSRSVPDVVLIRHQLSTGGPELHRRALPASVHAAPRGAGQTVCGKPAGGLQDLGEWGRLPAVYLCRVCARYVQPE